MPQLTLGTTTLAALALLIGAGLGMGRVGIGAAAGTPAGQAPQTAAEREPIALPTLRLVYQADRGLQLSGTVPDELERAALLRQARAVYGRDRVVDQLQAGAVANPSWLSPAFLPDLRGARQATAQLADARLEIDGEADSPVAQAAVARAVASYPASGLQVVNRLTLRTQ